ncbi:MAG: hypothetical protein RMJ87_05795 [Cytophagales bacterium]|nr:sodium/proton-translocating pyrophosphatase [Bernardetiaceae bacterium]MDW8204521.1 hypothetical protein [Cytophagales bacterium]
MLPHCCLPSIVQRNFIPLFVLATAVGCILYFHISPTTIKWAVVTGLVQSLFTVVLTHLLPTSIKKQKWWQLFFTPRPFVSLGILFVALLAFLIALLLQLSALSAHLSIFAAFAHTLLGFAAGTATTWILADLLITPPKLVHAPPFKIEYEYIQIFLAAVIAAAFLGITLIDKTTTYPLPHLPASVLIPLLYGMGSICIALLPAYLADNSKQALLAIMGSIAAALLLAWMASWLVQSYFPFSWVKNGKEYTANQLVYIWWLAIGTGFATGSMERIYQLAAKRYVDYLLHHPARKVAYNVLLHIVIHHIIAYIPTILVIATLLYAYFNGSMYGVAIAVLGMVSNLGTGKVMITNQQLKEYLQRLTAGAKRKLRLLSPPMATIIGKHDKFASSETLT